MNDPYSAAACADEKLRQTVRQVFPADDLVAVFSRAAVQAGCTVTPAVRSRLAEAIAAVLKPHSAKTVWLEPDLVAAFPELPADLPSRSLQTKSACDDDTLFSVDAGITGVAAAVAETGSLVCTSGPARPRGGSLIPPVHVAIVSASQILPDLCDYFDSLGSAAQELPANINLITGPSKTADVEGVLVTGVHGPGHVHVLLLPE